MLENTLVESGDDVSSTPNDFIEAEWQIRLILDQHPDEHATFYVRCSFQSCASIDRPPRRQLLGRGRISIDDRAKAGPGMMHDILRVDEPMRPAPNRQKLIMVGSSAIVSNGR